MSAPTELSFEEMLKFMLAHNGKVTNHDLVKHFKVFLMNPDMREEARSTFKKHVNMLAIIKNQNNEKWLILKKKYLHCNSKDDENENQEKESPSVLGPESTIEPSPALAPSHCPPPLQLNQDFNMLSSTIPSNQDYIAPSAIDIPKAQAMESVNYVQMEDVPPKIHPRKKSGDNGSEKRSSLSSAHTTQRLSIPNEELSQDEIIPLTSSRSESMLIDNEQKISVKERKQMFNRMASESDVVKSNKLSLSQSVDEEDRASLDHKGESGPLDPKQKQWILCASRGEYHTLAKMCKDNSKLVKTKDPFTTAMHWACKRGDENLVKLLAGSRSIVNERSGYTPLHIAMQFHHENVYKLLVEVYGADPNIRDWSGKKPRQYLVLTDTCLSPGFYRKKESFLRIGSLNVRVKKTTEAFSNFLGVGATRSSQYISKSRDGDRRSSDGDHVHKSWGSADNIQKDDKLMPPPSGKVKRRGASGRKGLAASHSRSTPSTPDQPRAQMGASEEGDSDSDSAAGFHAAWRHQPAS